MRRIALMIACLLAFGASTYVAPVQAGRRCSGQVQPSKTVSDPTVTGPIEGGIRTGQPYGTTMVPLKKGWVEEEFFVGGTARTYTTPAETEAPFTTRILVRRPTDPADFNGTVILDWNNVTLATDRDVAWQRCTTPSWTAATSTYWWRRNGSESS